MDHDAVVFEVSTAEFEALVADALDGIPGELGAAMQNVGVVVDDQAPASTLLGLYQGVPLTR
jgi:predicted Zn-dependent protease with MMP-like domain